ncbi:acyltransferase [Vibrio alginolyticus]|nr:acyltransferase [Vibrio alginolyticus]MCS0231414.1 acyltransferase [Vibrio alginolyticus]MCS0274652.1 acyltransferase [Vibrio alginolyticus]
MMIINGIIKKLLSIPQLVYLIYAKKNGLRLGHDCRIMKNVSFGSEPHLIEIRDEVTISFNVSFITHDGATWVFRDLYPNVTKFSPILVKKRAFIGANSTILPGVSIGERSIVAAGSVVTRDIPDQEVWGGVPARKIMTFENYLDKLGLEAYE